MAIRRRRRRRSRRITPKFLIILILLIVAVLMGILAISSLVDGGSGEPNSSETQKPGGLLDGLFGQDTPSPTLSPTPSPTPEPTPTPIPDPTSVVTGTVDTTGAKWGYHSELEVDGVEVERYTASESDSVYFGSGEEYAQLPGVVTFRGTNYRQNPY